jgi:hypothetical protein
MTDVAQRILDVLNAEIVKRGGDLSSIKSETAYARQLDKDVRDLFNGKMTEREFTDRQVDRIDNQFNRAWNEGMRANGLDPKRDMTDEWAKVLDDRKVKELDYIEGYASQIADAGKAGGDIEPFRARVDMWSNRYNEVQDLAKVTTRPEDRFEWVEGPTSDKCDNCLALDGIVATGKDWAESGWKPQSYDLACHGYHCQCRWEQTDKPLTKGGIPSK